MAERRRTKKRKEEVSEKINPEENAVAKHLRHNLPDKKTMLFNHKVDYFVASKAVDCLLDSPFAKKSKSKEALFTTRESVIEFLNRMLAHKFFHRARKIPVTAKDSKKKKKDESSDEKDAKKTKKKAEKDEDTDSKTKKEKKKEDEEKKKKKKFKLDMHLEQIVVDGPEIYVWIYDPIPVKAWFIGGFLVIGAILLCLFPLWPSSVRKGVYYISIAAAAFLVVILSLVLIRVLVFCIVWAITFGKHHLWLFPNLTEDVGFLESFWPLYKYEYRGASSKKEGEEDSELVSKDKNKVEEESSKTKAVSSIPGTEHAEGDNSEDNGFEVLDADDKQDSGNSES